MLERLTPSADITLGKYGEILDEVLEDEKLYNIALMGGYGAGKSSVIRAYEQQHLEKNFLHITLTRFGDPAQQEDTADSVGKVTEESLDDGDDALVGKLINQMVHQMRIKDIPQTRFQVKELVKPWKPAFYSGAILLVCISSFYAANYWGIKNIAEKLDSALLRFWCSLPGMGMTIFLCLMSLGFLLYSIVRRQLVHPFITQLNFKNGSIPMQAQENDRGFDKYLDEVIYLFQKGNVDGVIFEDIDRFGSNKIFVKLREMNYLINERKNYYYTDKQLQKNKEYNQRKLQKHPGERVELKKTSNQVKFIYLLKDELFDAEERTKFFDVIVPIVPVVDTSNSCDQLMDIFKKHGEVLSEEQQGFVKKVSRYFSDMRVLKNIYNEFSIYHTRLTENVDIAIQWQNMFAYIAYKNTFPDDFAKLQQEKGFLWTVIHSKQEAVRIMQLEVDRDLGELREERKKLQEAYERERRSSEEELIAELFPAGDYVVDGKRREDFATHAEYIKAICKEDTVEKISYVRYSGSYYNRNASTVKVAEILQEIKDSESYQSRIERILEKQEGNKLIELDEEIAIKEEERRHLGNQTLQQIYQEHALWDFFTPKQEKQFTKYIGSGRVDLLTFLVRNGNLDESYHDYLTYFYGEDIEDKNFLLNFQSGRGMGYDYTLKNPAAVLAEMDGEDLRRSGALNFDLLQEALARQDQKARQILSRVREEKNTGFLLDYLKDESKRGATFEALLSLVAKVWDQVCVETLADNEHTVSEKNLLIRRIGFYGVDDVQLFNQNNCITKYALNSKDYLELQSESGKVDMNLTWGKRLQYNFRLWGIRFKTRPTEKIGENLHRFVLENGFFLLNREMVQLYLSKMRGVEKAPEDLLDECLSSDDILRGLVEKEPESFAYNVLLEQPEEALSMKEEAVLQLLKWLENLECVEGLVRRWSGSVSDIARVKSEQWGILFESGKVLYTQDNVLQYFGECDKKLAPELITYLNQAEVTAEAMNKPRASKALQDLRSPFMKAVLVCPELATPVYEKLMTGLNFYYAEGFPFADIADEKMRILIQHNIVHLTPVNYADLKSNYEHLLPFYVSQHMKLFREMIGEAAAGTYNEDIKKIIESGELRENSIKSLLKSYEGTIRIQKKWGDILQAEIVQNYLSEEDVPELMKDYQRKGERTRESIRALLKLYAPEIAEYKFGLCSELLDYLLGNGNIEEEVRKRVLIGQMPYMTVENTGKYLNLAVETERGEWLKILDKKQAKIAVTDENKSILMRLRQKKMISSFGYDPKADVYRVYMKRKAIS